MSTPTRPVLRYHGGKFRLAPWIIQHMPAHRIYVEPYGGAASVLMLKPRCYAEIYNDLDSEVVNVFRVLRDSVTALRLREMLTLTPFAREEFEGAYLESADLVEQARRTIVKAFMGFGSNAIHASQPRGMRTSASTWKSGSHTGFLSQLRGGKDPSGFAGKGGWGYTKPVGFRSGLQSGSTHATDWARYPVQIGAFCARLAGVVIENRPALEVIAQHDREDALIYVDPPYVHETRNRRDRHGYRHEMSDDDHRALATALHQVAGMVLLSGYPCPLYDEELYPDWRRVTRTAMADGAKERTEVLYLNPAAAGKLQPSLFEEKTL